MMRCKPDIVDIIVALAIVGCILAIAIPSCQLAREKAIENELTRESKLIVIE